MRRAVARAVNDRSSSRDRPLPPRRSPGADKALRGRQSLLRLPSPHRADEFPLSARRNRGLTGIPRARGRSRRACETVPPPPRARHPPPARDPRWPRPPGASRGGNESRRESFVRLKELASLFFRRIRFQGLEQIGELGSAFPTNQLAVTFRRVEPEIVCLLRILHDRKQQRHRADVPQPAQPSGRRTATGISLVGQYLLEACAGALRLHLAA